MIQENSDFKTLIRNGSYVDKTEYIYRLAKHPTSICITRPEGFGKTLFCSTYKALFEGRKNLFKGLFIAENTDYDFKPYPVFFFSFSDIPTDTFDNFHAAMIEMVRNNAEAVGITLDNADYSPSGLLNELTYESYKKTGKECVIIIDDYDALYTTSMKDEELFHKVQMLFINFMRVVKNMENLRALLVTGTVRIPDPSMFASTFTYVDITFDKYADKAFGYTDEEIEQRYGMMIDKAVKDNPEEFPSRDAFMDKLRKYYGGYRFVTDYEHNRLYNPSSIDAFFRNGCRFDTYMKATEDMRLGIENAKEAGIIDKIGIENEHITIARRNFVDFDFPKPSWMEYEPDKHESARVFLYSSGLLTIDGICEYSYDLLMTKFPNREAEELFKSLL